MKRILFLMLALILVTPLLASCAKLNDEQVATVMQNQLESLQRGDILVFPGGTMKVVARPMADRVTLRDAFGLSEPANIETLKYRVERVIKVHEPGHCEALINIMLPD